VVVPCDNSKDALSNAYSKLDNGEQNGVLLVLGDCVKVGITFVVEIGLHVAPNVVTSVEVIFGQGEEQNKVEDIH
jgi:hypothetical protein